MKTTKITSDKLITIIFYIFLTFISLICLFPIVFAFIGSISTESYIAKYGFTLFPEKLSLDTYKYVFLTQGSKLLNAYKTSIIVTVGGTLISIFVTITYAYVITVKDFKFGRFLAFFAYFTMIFNGGMLPWYLVTTKYLCLKDSYLAMMLPYAMNVFNMYLMRNFIKSLPYELIESAQIDGAGHFRILLQMILPLSKAGLVTIILFYALQYWNDFYLPLMLINKENYYSIQYILYKMMANIQFLSSNSSSTMAAHVTLPTQTIKMAITCIAIGPIILLYPFVQKHFVKGVTVGALKG